MGKPVVYDSRTIQSLLRQGAPNYDAEAARVVATLTPELIEIEDTILAKFSTRADAGNYCALSSRLLSAMGALGLQEIDLNAKSDLSTFVGTRIMESVIGRSGKDASGKLFFFSGAQTTQLPARSTVIRRLPNER